jgi:hypothetical protein
MPSLHVRWRISDGEYSEITINDVLGEVDPSPGQAPCEALGEKHSEKMFIVKTKLGVYVLCRRCCKQLGLPS